METPGLLIVLSGPSGAGKGTLCKMLREAMPELEYSVSVTTRAPRIGEVEGVNYYYVDKATFERMIENDELLEWAKVYDNYYGTPKKKVMEHIKQGKDIILEIDIQGAMNIKKQYPQGVFIFIVPPSIKELEERITKRGTDSAEAIKKRLSCACEELSYVSEYDYVIVNDTLENAIEKLKAVIIAEKCRPQRKRWRDFVNKPTIDELLDKIDSKYSLVVVAAKRARSFAGIPDSDGLKGEKPVTRALKEIAAGKITYEQTKTGIK